MTTAVSERDKKLILLLIFVAVAVLPFFLVTKNVMEKNDVLMTENTKLRSRKSELEAYALNKDTYIAESDALVVKAQELLGRFPSDYNQESMLVFFNEAEKKINIDLYQASFGEDKTAQMVSESEEEEIEEVEEEMDWDSEEGHIEDTSEEKDVGGGFVQLTATTQFTYDATYDGFKQFLNYIKNHQNRMVISNLTASYSGDLGLVNGAFTITQYALKGEGRDNFAFLPPDYRQGTSNIFTEATGIFDVEVPVETYIPDFFIMLNQPDADEDAFIAGQSSDISRESYISSDDNTKKEITVTFTGSEGSYEAVYAVGEDNNEDAPVAFTKEEGSIHLDLLSSLRAGEEDKVELNVVIVNETDRRVEAHVKNDPDGEEARIRFTGNSGDVEVKYDNPGTV